AAPRRSTAAVFDQGPDLGAAGVQEAVGERAAEALGVVGRAAEALADQALAVEAGEEALDLEGPGVGRTGQGAGRKRAGPAKAPEERPLGPQGDPRWAVGEGAEQAEGAGVVLAGLDGQGALPRGRDERLRVEGDGRLSGQAEAGQAGRGQDDRGQLAAVDAADPAVDVAADRDQLQVGPEPVQQRDPAWAAGADPGPGPKVVQAGQAGPADEAVAGGGAPGHGGQDKGGDLGGGQVLGRVDGQVGPPVQHRLLHGYGEDALAPKA